MTLRLAYYADDFTGATDALEQLELLGVRTALFLETPTAEQVASLEGVEAVGVAGKTRSLPTEEIEAEVRPALEMLRDIGAPHVHYKVCSTFDSSPEVGSIGRVIDVAATVFNAPFTPVVVGAPHLGRWCVFGNLFAGVGIGAETEAFRLDRHPSMSRHPVTPADEADLRRVLGKQTYRRIGLIDVRDLALDTNEVAARLAKLLGDDAPESVLFDCLEASHLPKIGASIDRYATAEQPLFSVGSSSVEAALTAHWSTDPLSAEPQRGADGPLLVLSGSCSPVTAGQVRCAAEAGLAIVDLSAENLTSDAWEAAAAEAADQAAAAFDSARGVVVTTNPGGEPRAPGARLDAQRLGAALGRVFRRVRKQTELGLTVVAGGDTSSYTARAMGVESLRFHAQLTPGAPVCELQSANPLTDGALCVFKGGQVGRPDFFTSLTMGAG